MLGITLDGRFDFGLALGVRHQNVLVGPAFEDTHSASAAFVHISPTVASHPAHLVVGV
jgi:hypothetical protein